MLDLIQGFLDSSSVLSLVRDAGYEIHLAAQNRGIQIEARCGEDQIRRDLEAPLWWDSVEPVKARILSQHLALLLKEAWMGRMEA